MVLPMNNSTHQPKQADKAHVSKPQRIRIDDVKQTLHASADALFFVRMFARAYSPKPAI